MLRIKKHIANLRAAGYLAADIAHRLPDDGQVIPTWEPHERVVFLAHFVRGLGFPLHHPQNDDIQATSLRSANKMQAQVVQVNVYMATTITFVINIVMKGKSPPSNMCTTTTNDIS